MPILVFKILASSSSLAVSSLSLSRYASCQTPSRLSLSLTSSPCLTHSSQSSESFPVSRIFSSYPHFLIFRPPVSYSRFQNLIVSRIPISVRPFFVLRIFFRLSHPLLVLIFSLSLTSYPCLKNLLLVLGILSFSLASSPSLRNPLIIFRFLSQSQESSPRLMHLPRHLKNPHPVCHIISLFLQFSCVSRLLSQESTHTRTRGMTRLLHI